MTTQESGSPSSGDGSKTVYDAISCGKMWKAVWDLAKKEASGHGTWKFLSQRELKEQDDALAFFSDGRGLSILRLCGLSDEKIRQMHEDALTEISKDLARKNKHLLSQNHRLIRMINVRKKRLKRLNEKLGED